MDRAGTNVKLNISAKSISLRTVEGNHHVTLHDMPKISFASGGDLVSNILFYYNGFFFKFDYFTFILEGRCTRKANKIELDRNEKLTLRGYPGNI